MIWMKTGWFRNLCLLVSFVFFFEIIQPMSHGFPQPDVQIEVGLAEACAEANDWLALSVDADYEDRFVQEKIAELDPGVDAAFAFVQNQIKFEAYRGSLRGARGTLWSEGANSLDKANLLVALLRGQGIGCRYVKGTLSPADTELLLQSMFDATLLANAVGYVSAKWPPANPGHSPFFQSLVTDHWWVELEDGTNLDPTFPGLPVGAARGTRSGSFFEVPDGERHKVTLRLRAEFHNMLSQFSEQVPLEQTFTTCETYGKALTIGHFVNIYQPPALIGGFKTYTYTPYIMVDDNDDDPVNNPLIRGTDYQEFFNNLIVFANTTLTRLTLEITVLDPGKEPEVYARDILDRVGYAARKGLGQPGTIDAEKPALTELDLVSLFIMPGFIHWNGVVRQQQALQALGAESQALASQVDALQGTDPSTWSISDKDAVERYGRINRSIQTLGLAMTTAMFLRDSDDYTKRMRNRHLMLAYYDTPRLTLCLSRLNPTETPDQARLKIGLDLRRNRIRAVPYPGQNAAYSFLFNIVKGRVDNFLEHEIMKLMVADGGNGARLAASQVDVWQASEAQGIPIVVLSNETDILTRLEGLQISAEAKARIADALRADRVVNVPSRMVNLGGNPAIAWWEIDKRTGELVAVSEDGGHQEAIEFALISALVFFSALFTVMIFGNRISAFFSSDSSWTTKLQNNNAVISSNVKPNYTSGFQTKVPLTDYQAQSSIAENTDGSITFNVGPQTITLPSSAINLHNQVIYAIGSSGSIIDFAGSDVEAISLFAPGSEEVSGTVLMGPGITLETVPDANFVVKAGESQIPSGFRARITNTGPSGAFGLEGSAPTGWSLLIAREASQIPAGVLGEVSIFLRPDETTPMPPPGSSIAFSLTAARKDNPAASLTQSVDFVMPEVHGLQLMAEPMALYTTPSGEASTTFTLTNTGNVFETVTLTLALPPGLSANSFSSPLSLAPGDSDTRTLNLTASELPLDTDHAIRVIASYGPSGEMKREALLILHVSAPGALQALNSSHSAEAMGRKPLAELLRALGQDLSKLYQDLSSEIFRSRVLAEIDALMAHLDDPLLKPFIPDLHVIRDVIAGSSPADLEQVLNDLGLVLSGFEHKLALLVQHDLKIALQPNTAVALPVTPTVFVVDLGNIGNQTTTYNLNLSGLPAGVTGTITPAAVTLFPGERTNCLGCQSVTAILTHPADKLTAFDFEVTAVVEGAPEITRNAGGSFTLRQELIQIVSVLPSPPFTDPGGGVDVTVRILNAVNQDRNVLMSYAVKNKAGETVFASPPVEASFTVLSSLDTFALGNLDTTGYPLGEYSIEVKVTELDETLIPGGEGKGALLIGSPITATLTVSPETLLPQGGTVSATLEIDSLVDYSNAGIHLMGLVDTDGDANTIALYDNYAYVGGSANITTLDVSDPLNPRIVGTFGETLGNGFIKCLVRGDRLYVASGSKLYVYSLADPAQPQPLGNTDGGYNYLVGGFIQGHHLYTSTVLIAFYSGSKAIICVGGNFLSYDVSDPAHPYRAWALSTGSSCYGAGGNYAIFQGTAVNEQIAFVPSTTATGNNTYSGFGKLVVMDISNPHAPSVKREIQIPGTLYLVGVAIDGNRALAVGSTTGYRNPGVPDFDPPGNMTLTTLDISDPENPIIIKTIDTGFRAHALARPASAGNHYFVLNGADSKLIVVDATDPQNLLLTLKTSPAQLNEVLVKGNLVYTVSASGLGIYDIGSLVGNHVTARVEVPDTVATSVVAGSFNLSPDEIISAAERDTFVWNPILSASQTSQSFTWEMALVQEEILTLSPKGRTIRPGEETTFVLTVANPGDAPVTYTLSLEGLPKSWLTLPSSVTVPARSSSDVILAIQSESFAPVGEAAFTVTAFQKGEIRAVILGGKIDFVAHGTAGQLILPEKSVSLGADSGTRGTVQGSLVISGSPLLPETHAIVVTLTPSLALAGQGTKADFTVRLTNGGNVTERFALAVAGLPSGFTSSFGQVTVEVPPGVENYRETLLTLTAPTGIPAGEYPFNVTAVSTSNPSVADGATGTLSVLSYGVSVSIEPNSGTPGNTFNLTVTNTGQFPDDFDLSLGGPAAPVATMATYSVSLAAGESRGVAVSLGQIDFAYTGTLYLSVLAVSRGNTSVRSSASAIITIETTRAVEAHFDPQSADIVAPGSARFLLMVRNVGNIEDVYSATITKVTGSVTASLRGLDGQPTQTIPRFRLPGLVAGSILLESNLSSGRGGKVTVSVASIHDPSVNASATAILGTANDPPVANAGIDRSVYLGSAASLDGSASYDPDSSPSPLTYEWSFASKPTGSHLTDNDILGRLDATASFLPDAKGPYVLRLTVSDGEDSALDEVEINVLNHKPVADGGPDRNVITGLRVYLDGSKSFDEDEQFITYKWSLIEKPPGSSLSGDDLPDDNRPDPSFTPDVDGRYRFQLVVNDGVDDSDPDWVDFHAAALNVPPNALAGERQSALIGEMVLLDGSRSNDPDNLPDLLTFQWSFKTLPPGSTLRDWDLLDRDQVNPSFVPDVAGTYVIELRASDGQDSDIDEVIVTASLPNTPPNARAGEDLVALFGQEVVLDGSESFDPDEGPNPLTYRWRFVSVPQGSALRNSDIFNADSERPRFTPDVAGSYVLKLVVSDGEAEDSDNVRVRVSSEPILIVSPRMGTIGTEFTMTGHDFGMRKGKLKMGGKPLKAMMWSSGMVRVRLQKPNPPGTYDINIMPKKLKGGAQIVIQEMDAFAIKAPEIGSMTPLHGKEGQSITLKGRFFGTKKGKIYLGEKACKVMSWVMDPVTGQGEASFLLPKGMPSGSYTITLMNKIAKGRIGGFTLE